MLPLDFNPSQLVGPNWFGKSGALRAYSGQSRDVSDSLSRYASCLPAAPCLGLGMSSMERKKDRRTESRLVVLLDGNIDQPRAASPPSPSLS